MELRHKAQMASVLDARLDARSFDNRSVFLFGHCNATEEMADYLMEHNVNPDAILDNNTSKQGLSYKKMPILPPEHIKRYTSENSVVLIAARFIAEMSAQLRMLGYGGEIVQAVEYNSFAEYSLTGEAFERRAERMLRGVKTLDRIKRQYPKHHMVVCPNNALGDVYWAMAFLAPYREKCGIQSTVSIVIGDGCRQAAELFKGESVIELELAEMDELVQAVIFTREDNCIIAHHDRPYTDNIIKYLDNRFLSFIDYYRMAVYGLRQDTQPTPPSRNQGFEKTERIIKNKTLILAPYAKSVAEPPDSFWESIAKKWHEKGYLVLTSVNSDENPIKGTLPLSLPLGQMVPAVERAGAFIGLRSGLCDIVHTSRCRKIAVFPDCYYSTTPHKVADFFALPGWEAIVYGGSWKI
ncbi:MAG: hypothetical protein LBU32_14965 [Clostridiales bacterium]|jgi:hypothetical protein|nr:hypothetical protein [Clostridiales bacterium]